MSYVGAAGVDEIRVGIKRSQNQQGVHLPGIGRCGGTLPRQTGVKEQIRCRQARQSAVCRLGNRQQSHKANQSKSNHNETNLNVTKLVLVGWGRFSGERVA